jgi:hypothetical protein
MASYLLSGESHSGKKSFIINLVNNYEAKRLMHNVVFFYNKWQSAYDSFTFVTKWENKQPTTEDIDMIDNGSILIIDGFGETLNKDITELFSVMCHHRNFLVFLLLESIYSKKNQWLSQIAMQATYTVLFRNSIHPSNIAYFARSFAPGNTTVVMENFKKATTYPYKYMLVDCTQRTPDAERLISGIFPHERRIIWPYKASVDFNPYVCQRLNCKSKVLNSKLLGQHIKIMHGDYLYACNIKSIDSTTNRETECVNRTLKKENFRDHLRDKHGVLVTDMKELIKWKQLKRGGPESKDSQSCLQCHDCNEARRPRKNASKNPRNKKNKKALNWT